MTPKSFMNAQQGLYDMWETELHGQWERARWMAAAIISPHTKKNLKPQDLCRFPWEKKLTKTQMKYEKIKAEAELYKKISDKNMKENG